MKLIEKNVVVLTDVNIPLYVIFIASLGSKFSYYVDDEKKGLSKYLVMFEKLKDMAENFYAMLVLKKGCSALKSKVEEDGFRDRMNVQCKAQKFIRLQKDKTRLFLKRNPEIKILRADKGGKAVIIEEDVYYAKAADYVKRCVGEDVYRRLDGLSFKYIRELCESKYREMREVVNEVSRRDSFDELKICCDRLSFEPFMMPRFYGCIKVHKEGFPVRPIISSTDCMAKPLSRWLLRMLDIVASDVRRNQVDSAAEFVARVEGVRMKHGHVLVGWDFENMFTNIPFSKTKEIIRSYYHLLAGRTSMECEMFLNCLSFVVEDTAFFSFRDEYYLQVEGLAMGNSLSQILAEITTSYCINAVLQSVEEGDVSFLYNSR